MKSWTAYLRETAYHKCLLISTCDNKLMKLKTLMQNAKIMLIETQVWTEEAQKQWMQAKSSLTKAQI